MKNNDWKDRLGVMYSTNPDYQYNTGKEVEEQTLPKEKQQLLISIDNRNRGGKAVTLVTGFRLSSEIRNCCFSLGSVSSSTSFPVLY